jgi:hypothetical protein
LPPSLLAAAVICLALAPVSGARGADCGPCRRLGDNRRLQDDALGKHKSLLARNHEYLAKLAPSDTSKLIKVRSNIVIINLRIETIENNIQSVVDAGKKAQCDKCPPGQGG